MKKFIIVALIAIFALGVFGCTSNQRARTWGGNEVITLKPGQRLDNITWKLDQLWLLQHSEPSKKPQTYTFEEKSSFGMVEGKITIIEVQ